MGCYRFTVPNGIYRSPSSLPSSTSMPPWAAASSDVRLEGTTVISGLDVLARAGLYHALDYSFVTSVTDGLLAIDFVVVKGRRSSTPSISCLHSH